MHINRHIILISATMALMAVMVSCAKKETPDGSQVSAKPFEPSHDIFGATEHMGVNYGPFHYNDQNNGSQVPLSQIQADLDLIAKNFKYIRTYTVAQGLDQVIPEAASRSIEVAVGIYCYPNDAASTRADIDLAVTRASEHPNVITAIVVGNETNLDEVGSPHNNYVDDATVAGYMDYAKKKLTDAGHTSITVSSCITGVGGLPNGMGKSHACPMIMQQCASLNGQGDRVIFMTIYPYYGQKSNNKNEPANIADNMKWSYENGMAQAEALGLDVVIGEIGWPSKGDDPNMENVTNEQINFSATLKWINGDNIYRKAYNTLWFSMFDEPWKTNEPDGIGPYWGLYAANGATTPKFTIPSLY